MGLGWFLAGLWLGDPENRDTAFDFVTIRRHVKQGGCMKQFKTAIHTCHYEDKPDAEACIKATAALRKCFAAKPEWFGDVFIGRLDEGLDQDLTPWQIKEEKRRAGYRWWTGMRRS